MKILKIYLLLLWTVSYTHAQNSVLSTGRWIKVGITQSGIYQITPTWLATLGIKSTSLGVYGHEIGELPQAISTARPTDLQPIPFLKQGDNVVFWAEKFTHHYSDTTFYFIRLDDPAPKPITEFATNSLVNATALDYGLSRFHYEPETYNLLQSGREWLGDGFFGTVNRSIQYPLPDYKTGLSSLLTGRLASASIAPGTFSFSIPGNTVAPITFPTTTGGRYDQKAYLQNFSATVYPEIKDQTWTWNLTYTNSTGAGYLDYLDLAYPRKFNALNENPHYYLPNKTDSSFSLSIQSLQAKHQVWLKQIGKSWQSLRLLSLNNVTVGAELLIFDPAKAVNPSTIELVSNQNIRADPAIDLVLIASPSILPAAKLLASYKNAKGISAKAYSTQEIFHEFSAGKQDVTAIRDFIRGKNPRYVLLMGDATVDYKGINKVATAKERINYVPSYESRESLEPLQTYVTDDYYGLILDNQGEWLEGNEASNEPLTVGIGRIPVRSLEEAHTLVNKLISYESQQWKQPFRFSWLADDGDANIHVQDAEDFASLIPGAFQINKTYLDQFPQELTNGFYSSASGKKASLALFNQEADFIHFLGHGSESAWTDEKIITNNELQTLKNSRHLPLLLTATCQFGRFDDPNQLSGAEVSLLSNQGGAIGLISTTRPVFQSSNYLFGQAFYRQLTKHLNNKDYRLGDLFKDAKNESQSGVINRNITLLGDPTLALPWNQQTLTIRLDTLASGIIQGQTTPSIDGEIQLYYYGKNRPAQTLGTKTDKFSYLIPGSIEGISAATVQKGKFRLANLPAAQLKWRATSQDGTVYGGGMSSQVKESAEPKETNAPLLEAKLVNEADTKACSPNPLLFIRLSDASSLRFVGPKGEVAYFTVNDTLQIPVASLFSPTLNSSQEGSITYPFESLAPGNYKISLTCFDIHTNQGNLTFEFTVSASAKGNRELQIYPNPMTERSSFSFLQEKRWTSYYYKLKIYSILGKQIVERKGTVPGSDAAYQNFSIDWSAEEKNQLDFINYYQLELTYDTGAPFASFSGRIGHIK
ncbi:type IX secretion system sortase PorU [Aquirufa sp. HETE-83D]|uniref:Type IX secretion system sortase PorU n=1 Tax=Aquirufa esocilacus TaxID=3096513 RepID=A0ABW6DLC3_9BACT